VHAVEKRKINMLYTDLCFQVFGKTIGYLPGDPVLPEGSLNKNPHCYDKEQQGEKKPEQYFFESLQGQPFNMQK
jgi:hypothetical protein